MIQFNMTTELKCKYGLTVKKFLFQAIQKGHRPDLKSAGLFRQKLFLNPLKTSTLYSLLTVCPVETPCM